MVHFIHNAMLARVHMRMHEMKHTLSNKTSMGIIYQYTPHYTLILLKQDNDCLVAKSV